MLMKRTFLSGSLTSFNQGIERGVADIMEGFMSKTWFWISGDACLINPLYAI